MDETEGPAPMFLDPATTNVFIDIENFGLDLVNDPPLEIGFHVTDLKLNLLHKERWVIWESWYNERVEELRERRDTGEDGAAIVYNMHLGSGLWTEAEEFGDTVSDTEADILSWFDEIGLPKGTHLIGSSVNFDRMILNFNLGKVFSYFHYRVIDISSLKVFAEKYAPTVAEGAKDLKPLKAHRVFSDLEDTINEFRYYGTHLLAPAHTTQLLEATD